MKETTQLNSEPPLFWTIEQVAKRWQTSTKTIRRLIEKKELIAHRFGRQLRIGDADLRAYERGHRGP